MRKLRIYLALTAYVLILKELFHKAFVELFTSLKDMASHLESDICYFHFDYFFSSEMRKGISFRILSNIIVHKTHLRI